MMPVAGGVPLRVLHDRLQRGKHQEQDAGPIERVEPALQTGALVLLVHEAEDVDDDVGGNGCGRADPQAGRGQRLRPAPAVRAAELHDRPARGEKTVQEGPGHRISRMSPESLRLDAARLLRNGGTVGELHQGAVAAAPEAHRVDRRACVIRSGEVVARGLTTQVEHHLTLVGTAPPAGPGRAHRPHRAVDCARLSSCGSSGRSWPTSCAFSPRSGTGTSADGSSGPWTSRSRRGQAWTRGTSCRTASRGRGAGPSGACTGGRARGRPSWCAAPAARCSTSWSTHDPAPPPTAAARRFGSTTRRGVTCTYPRPFCTGSRCSPNGPTFATGSTGSTTRPRTWRSGTTTRSWAFDGRPR